MNISLFSPTLSLIVFGLFVSVVLYLCTQIDKKHRLKVLPIAVVLGIGLSFLLVYLAARISQSAGDLPARFWIMIFPFGFSIFLLPGILLTRWYIKKHTKRTRGRKKVIKEKVAGLKSLIPVYLASILCGLVFTLLLTNNYYHYYPTLDTVFGIGQPRVTVLNQQNKIVLQYNNGSVNNDTIEASIYNTNPATDEGKLYSLDIPGKVSKFKTRSGWLYVPSIAFNSSSLVKLPVLVMLPGAPGSTNDVLYYANLYSNLVKLAKANHGITPIVYVADDNGTTLTDTECVNSPKGNVETYLAVDVPNYIKSHFNVSDDPSNWAIGGISMGGMCGVMLTLTHPNVYHYFVDIGGQAGPQLNGGDTQFTIDGLFGGSTREYNLHNPLYLLATNKYKGIGGFFGDGTSDIPLVEEGTNDLYNAMRKDGFDVVHVTVNGGHTFNIFGELMQEAVPWISNRVGATECSSILACQ